MKLKDYLKLTNKEEKQAAYELNVSQAAFNRWITGVRKPCKKNLNDIYRWSNHTVTPNDFYLDEIQPETGGNVGDDTDSVNDEFNAEEDSFDEDNPSPDAA